MSEMSQRLRYVALCLWRLYDLACRVRDYVEDNPILKIAAAACECNTMLR